MTMNKIQLRETKVLFIVHNFNNFQKDPIDKIASNFSKAFVLIRYKPFSKILRYFPQKLFNKYRDQNIVNLKNTPENVEIIRTQFWYLPYGIFNRILGYQHLYKVKRVIKKYEIDFDIIHTHFLWSSGFVGMKLKQHYGVPLVVTGHGYDVYKLPLKNVWWKRMTRKILSVADKIITVSNINQKILKSMVDEESKIEVLFNGYNADLFQREDRSIARSRLKIDENKKILLTIGNLEKVKGHKYLIEAMKALANHHNIHLYIIGAGTQSDYLSKLIKEYKLKENISLVGYISHEEINNWLNACDIFILPSLNEGLPTVLLEALGCGKPIVSTAVGGIPEIIKSEDYGLLVEPENAEVLSSAIQKALDKTWDENKIEAYGKNFTVKRNVSRLVEIYENLLQHND